jgi:K+-sensing histidine kinase KdpD
VNPKTVLGLSLLPVAVWAMAVAAALLAVITWVDYATGYELGLFIFYFVPVSIAAWYAGRRPGIAIALVAALCWYLADRLSGHSYSKAYLIYWETMMRFVSFLTTAWTLAAIHDGQRRQESLLRAVSHDLRAPLAAIAGQAQILSAHPGDPAFTAARTAAILRSVRRMDRMVEDLLDGARLSSGRLSLKLEPLDVRAWLPVVLQSAREELEVDRVELSLPGHPTRVRADPERLERVVLNLLSNALKYSPPEERVSLSAATASDGWTTITVSDRGWGLSTEDRRRLLEPFHRGTASTGRSGVGLGLVSAAGLVKAHRGRMRVRSEPGAGATFMVDLPAIAPATRRGAIEADSGPTESSIR